MRLLHSAAVAALVILPLGAAPLASVAFAQAATPDATAPVTPAPETPAPAAPAPMAPDMKMAPAAPAKKQAHKHQTLQERFDAANTTHDGHLTKEQASAAKWTYISKHFTAIDKGKKGYVTVDDIHAFAHATHTAKHPAPKPAAAAPAAPAAPATTN